MIRIVCVGKIKEKAMLTLIEEYQKRMTPIQKVEIIELSHANFKDSEVDSIVKEESARILSRIDDRDYVVLLDLKGKMLDSNKLALLCDKGCTSGKNLIFIIGGAHGVGDEVKARADFMWKISDLTFPHQLIRLMLMEQIYRAFMILRNHPYHK